MPTSNVSTLLYSATAHFHWSFDGAATTNKRADTGENFLSPWVACNTSEHIATYTKTVSVRVKNTGTTSVSINRCEKWPPLIADGYFDLLLETGPVSYRNTKGDLIALHNADASKRLCSVIQNNILYNPAAKMEKYYQDLRNGLFDGNCANQAPCPRLSNVEDCIALNIEGVTAQEDKDKDCIYIGNFDANPEKFWQEKCLVNPSKCEGNGFTMSLWIKYNYTWLVEPQARFLAGTDYGANADPLNMFTNPGDYPIIGWGFWHYTLADGQHYLRVTVTDTNYLYVQEVAITDGLGVIWPASDDTAQTFWTNIGFRWKRVEPGKTPSEKDYYIDIFIFGRQCELSTGFTDEDPGCILMPNTPNNTVANVSGTYPVFSMAPTPIPAVNATGIYIGCQGDAWGSSGTVASPKKFYYTSAIIDDVAFWAWRLRDEEIPYLLGGKAMPKININPDRAKSVNVIPEPVNPYYAMADMHYKFIITDFKPATDPTYRAPPYFANLTVEPLYAERGMVNVNFPGRADPRGSTAGIDPSLLKTTFATQLMNSSSYFIVDPRTVSGGGTVEDCPHNLDKCTRGFSLGIWVFLPATASLRVMNDHYTIMRNIYNSPTTADERIAKSWELYTEGNHVFVRIRSQTYQFPGDCTSMLGRWVNLAFSWREDLGAQTYINGLPTAFVPQHGQLTFPTVMGAPAVTPNIMDSRSDALFKNFFLIVGSDGYLASSLAGMAVNDLVIFQTYLHSFETHKFLGMTEKEAVVLWNATMVWSADYFIVRERALFFNKFGGMWLHPDTGIINININDTDVKGKTVMTTNTTNGYLGLRDPVSNTIFLNQSTSCLANPSVCDTSGATYGGFFLISQTITHPGRHYILTTGAIDEHCIGIALWLEVDTTSVPNRALFVEVSRYSDFNVNNGKTANYAQWRIGIPAMDLKGFTWYHFAITWSLDAGMYFFINGVAKGWASRANIVGVDSISDAKPPWRYDNRVLLGINPFKDGAMESTGFISYETFAVYHKMFSPLDIPKVFGLTENPWYGTATVWFDRFHLISNWQQQWYDIRLAIARGYIDAKYGHANAITLTKNGARFDKTDSYAPIMLMNSTSWRQNLTVAIWVKINIQQPGQVIFATDKYLDGNRNGIRIRTNSLGLDIPICSNYPPNDGSVASWQQILGKWINVAISYNFVGGVTTCWINGVLTTANYQNPAPQITVGGNQVDSNSTFVVGGIDYSLVGAGKQDFEVHQLAIYQMAMSNIAQLGLMMGMPQQEAIYLITSNYYWSFSGPAHDLLVPHGSISLPTDASYEIDRRIQGRALRTVPTAKSCVNLGNFAGTCLTNITLCAKDGFTFSIWIKLVNLTASGYVFSTGGQQPGQPGIYISVNQGVLGVGVSNGTYMWSRLRIYIATSDLWFNLMFRWNLADGLEVYVNGQLQTDDVAIGQNSPIRNAQLMYLFTNATVGCSNSDMSKVVGLYVDDIWFRTNYTIKPLTTDDCPAYTSYRNVFLPQMLDQTLSVEPYNALKKSMATPVYEVVYPSDWKAGNIMDPDKQCPGDLTKCPNGFTVSFWFMLPSLKQFSRPLLSLRSSQLHGIQVYLDNQNLQQSLRIELRNNTHRWLVTVADYVDTNKWLQLTAAWDTRQLTVYTLNRQYAPVYAQRSPGSGTDWSMTYSIGVTLDSGIWQYYVEDLNIWSRYLDNLKAYPMGVSCVSLYTDYVPDDLPTPPVLTSSLTIAGVCYLTSEDGKTCILTKEQWDRGAVQGISSADYFKVLTMLQGKGAKSSDADDLGIAKYQPQVAAQDILSVKKQIMNGAIMTLTDRTKSGLSKTAYDFVQLCSSVLYPIRSKETWQALASQGDSAMGVADALEVFGGKVVANLIPVDIMENDTMNLNNSVDIHSDNIIFTAEVFPPPIPGTAGNFSSNYTFPNYERIALQAPSFSKKWDKDDTFDSIVIPPSVLNNIQCETCPGKKRDKVTVVASLYDTMGEVVPPVLDTKSSKYRSDVKTEDVKMISRVISLTFNPKIKEDDNNDIRVSLQHREKVPGTHEPFCAFYTADRTWNTTGCKVVNYTDTQTICSCTHLTNFAILMQPLPIETEPIDDLILSILSYVGIIISMLCLMCLFYLFVTKTKLHNERNTIHINLVVALFLANLFFLFTGPAQYLRMFCRACAALMHYFYTATFMWLLMEGTYLFNAVVSGVIRGRLCCMIPLAWGVPVLVVAGVLAVDPEAYGGDSRCWLSFDRGFIFAFIGPIILIVVLNAALLGLIVYNMPNTVLKRDTKFYGKILRGIRHAAVLLPLFGVTWLFGLFAVNQSTIIFQYFFVIFNSLQGFFIFLGFGWFQPDVRRYMCARDDDMDDEDDPHKDVVNSESDLKTILSTMPPPTPEMERKTPVANKVVASSYDVNETSPSPSTPSHIASAGPSSARPVSGRQVTAASQRARTSFLRPATSLMRPKSGAPSFIGSEANFGTAAEEMRDDDDEALKARELMDYLLDGKRVKDVPDFASAPKSKPHHHESSSYNE